MFLCLAKPTLIEVDGIMLFAMIFSVLNGKNIRGKFNLASIPISEILKKLLFGFDKYNLTSEGKEVLTSLVNRNKDMQSAMVIGYADPLGSDSYNKRLSQRRAQTVKAFLVSKGLNANTITTEGRGESKLKVTQADCKGQNLIACYAPNRRVEITIK